MTTTVRIRRETREALRELESRTGKGTQELLHRAVEQFRRSLILAETNAAYGGLGDRPDRAEIHAELKEWEATLGDEIEDDA
jgi:hypothetical protein